MAESESSPCVSEFYMRYDSQLWKNPVQANAMQRKRTHASFVELELFESRVVGLPEICWLFQWISTHFERDVSVVIRPSVDQFDNSFGQHDHQVCSKLNI